MADCKVCATKGGTRFTGMGKLPWIQAINGSPVLQYAWMLGLPMVPFHINIRAVFNQSTGATTQQMSFEGSNQRLNMTSAVAAVKYQIDAPNSYAGQSTKPISDWYFQRQSGIQATMIVDGAPRYVVAPFFTPIETLLDSLEDQWPAGWVIEPTQSVIMQFQSTAPLITFPTTVTVTFRLWQPGNGQNLDFQMMTNDMARERIQTLIQTGKVVRDLPMPGVAQ